MLWGGVFLPVGGGSIAGINSIVVIPFYFVKTKTNIGVCGRRTTSPHISTGQTRLYTQQFAANRMSGKFRV